MATYRPDGTRIRKRDKKKNRGNVGVGTPEPAGNIGEGNVGVETSAPAPEPEPAPEPAPEPEPEPAPEPAPEPDPEPSGPIVSDDRDEEDAGEVK